MQKDIFSQVDTILSKLQPKRSTSSIAIAQKYLPFPTQSNMFQTANQNLADTSFSAAMSLVSVEAQVRKPPVGFKSRSRPHLKTSKRTVAVESYSYKPEINKHSKNIDKLLRNSEVVDWPLAL